MVGIWALLVAATLGSWTLGGGHGVALIAVAFVKVRLVGLYFMELRAAPVALRVAFEGWVVAAAGILVGLYLSGV